MKLLVVDDSQAMRRIVVRTLQRSGLPAEPILQASAAREALTMALELHPDLVLADWNMPEMGGLELLRELRARGSDAAVGFVTSVANQVRRAGIEAGARFVIPKPVTTESLREAIGPLMTNDRPTLPGLESVAKMLSVMLGFEVEVEADNAAFGLGPVVAGLYKGPAEENALLILDRSLAVAVAAAMNHDSPDEAEGCGDTEPLPDAALESLGELLRVATALFSATGVPTLTLRSIHEQLHTLPSRAVALAVSAFSKTSLQVEGARHAPARAAFRVDLDAWGKGRLLFVC